MGLLVFRVAFERWMGAPEEAPFAPLAAAVLADLRRRATALHAAPAAAGSTG